MTDPCKIKEGNTEYSLGAYDGTHLLYDFKKVLHYLHAKGQLLFGPGFKIYEDDKEIIYKLVNYFIREEANCKKLHLDMNKGLLLTGPVGCGKTSLMKLLRHIVPHQKSYELIPCRNIAFEFNHLGYKVIQDYGNQGFYCFDDLGVEPQGRYYGQDCNVMGEILISRYELFEKHGIRTHITTNLNADELEERYGNRVRSRMRRMFNLVSFHATSKDKRR
ncbi:ATPase [Zhouia spongiae]|uniref:ATPase n=1 Tax=Zhouia spongiae TaxID=2202721 RepID=A0ABY3YKI3_9FLAO|nr:ATPase [Zhouia spongiae]UNY98337.1 ATPase [Zhouia spongiae]